jgi:3alpha(or 20beta)-hydroxysteroid dehydrogenase
MPNRVENRVALVTGGARGSGASHGEMLAQEGATVILGDVLDEEGEAEAARHQTAGLSVEYRHLDVTQAAEWQALVDDIERRHGRLDVLVNNAGIGAHSNVETCTDEDWFRILAVNQTGVFYGMRAAIPAMRRAGGGSIVNIGANVGFSGAPFAAYVASKHAVVGLTKSAAISHAADNIRVNVITPGIIDTPRLTDEVKRLVDIEGQLTKQAMPRMGTTREISYAVVYLASDEASFVTGIVLAVAGGLLPL